LALDAISQGLSAKRRIFPTAHQWGRDRRTPSIQSLASTQGGYILHLSPQGLTFLFEIDIHLVLEDMEKSHLQKKNAATS
jgi:hypothetical protein